MSNGSAPGDGNLGADFSQKLQAGIGVLLTAFIAGLNFVGLKDGEISDVLRNDGPAASLIMLLLLAAILASAASIFVGAHSVRWPLYIAGGAFLVTTIAFVVREISIPNTATHRTVDLIVGIVAAIIFFVALLAALCSGKKDLSLQAFLVLLSIGLLSVSLYAGVRLETRSQSSFTEAQLSVSLTETSNTASLLTTVSASKLKNDEHVGVRVLGLNRDLDSQPVSIETICALPSVQPLPDQASCVVDPCDYASETHVACVPLSGDIFQPTGDGSISETLTIPIAAKTFQHIEITAQVCSEPGVPLIRTQRAGAAAAGRCTYDQDVGTRFDLAVPDFAR